MFRKLTLALLAVLVSFPALASEGAAAHEDPAALVVLYLAVVLLGAKLGGDVAQRLRQPEVLGELVMGVLLGNLPLLGIHALEGIKTDIHVDMFARLGVLILLFEVGLESTVAQMLKVGLSSFVVATVGVVVPFGLGWLVGAWLLPGHSVYVHVFLGATLTATSVGITARVLKDLSASQTSEARVILGAAVIDDVLGLIILAVVSGIISAAATGGALSYGEILVTLVKATGFLVGALVLGVVISPRLFRLASHLRARGVLLAVGLSFCFLLSWLASVIGLAPIVGAFAAGLILEDVHYQEYRSLGDHTLEDLIHPISGFLVPVFFVLMGMRTDLTSFTQPGVLGLAAGLTVVAILGKQVCGLGVLGRGVDRITVGIGMIPRGEVGLIFANIGMTLVVAGEPVVSKPVFSAVVIMVIVTTMITPPLLTWRLRKVAPLANTAQPEHAAAPAPPPPPQPEVQP
ncbi:MAG: cation:proton antiporter [Myxococcota bacterium]